MTNVAAGQDTYSVSKIRTSQGRQGEAWSAVLFRGKRFVANVVNEANGGALLVYFTEREEESRFNSFIESEKAAIPENKIDEESSKMLGHDVMARSMLNGDIWIENRVNKTLDDRMWTRLCKTRTLFQVGAEIGGPTVKILKGTSPDVREHLARKFPGEKIRFLNDEYR